MRVDLILSGESRKIGVSGEELHGNRHDKNK
jgi:hypothetical protein